MCWRGHPAGLCCTGGRWGTRLGSGPAQAGNGLKTEQDFGILKESMQRKICRDFTEEMGQVSFLLLLFFWRGIRVLVCFSKAKVCVFKKFQDNLNALKSSSGVPLKGEILDQQIQEGRA